MENVSARTCKLNVLSFTKDANTRLWCRGARETKGKQSLLKAMLSCSELMAKSQGGIASIQHNSYFSVM